MGNKVFKRVSALVLALLLFLQGAVPAMELANLMQSVVSAPALTYALAEEQQDNADGSETDGIVPEGATNDLDGSKIEGIKVVWVTEDSKINNDGETVAQAELNDKSHLYLATTSSAALSMIYKVEVEFSGQYDYAPGDITITIPAQVWHGRQYEATGVEGETVGVVNPGTLLGTLELPLPAAPSKKADFNWQIIDGNYVLTNTRTIGATSSVSIEVAIRGIRPIDVVDMSESDPITAHCEVVTNQGNTIELTSLPINAQIDTKAYITSAYKNGEVFEEYPGLPDELLQNLPEGTNPEDYLYVRWYTYHSHTNNQPFSLDITDVLSDAYEYTDGPGSEKKYVTDGIFLGSTNYKGEIIKDGTIDFAAEIVDHDTTSTTGTQYSHTVYMWSAYKKSDFYVPYAYEPQRVYYFENEVEWTLTETDKAVSADQWNKPEDPQKVTTKTDSAAVLYSPIRFGRPTGSFAVNKWTEVKGYKDWLYGYALNLLDSNRPVDMDYVVETIGYGYPWTSPRTTGYSYGDLISREQNAELDQLGLTEDDYGLLGWKQVTDDFQTFFNFESTPLTSEDFEMKGLRISEPTRQRWAKQSNGVWAYQTDNSLPIPDLVIEYQLNNEDDTWYPAATATWGEDGKGEFRFVDVSGECSVSGKTVYFPENTTDTRHTFVSNVFGGKTAEKCDIAMLDWYVYPIITMKPSDRVRQIVRDLFEQNENPTTKFKNDVIMDVYGWVGEDGEGTLVLDDDFDASRATFAGASYGVSLNKSSSYETDVENQRLLIHYKATLTEQSNLENRSDYDAAVAENVIPAETSGVWYDLLPPHVVPLLDTVKLRSGDTISSIYTIDNYKDTGRTLLVVEADLTPKPSYRNSLGYADQPTLEFTAAYTWLDMDEYGQNLVNYVAFESTVDNLNNGTLGTIKNQKGEPDNPLAGNNATTPKLPADIAEALTGLNPDTVPDENRFVYGKCDHNVSALVYAVSGLEKSVSDDLVGIWTQGLDGQEQVTVYEGLGYSYRLRVSSAENTSTKGIIIYDTIENYIIPDPSADEDTDATKAADFEHTEERKDWSGDWQGKGQWRGTLKAVDLSEFVNAGVAPVLLYSQLPGLQFADSKSGSTDDNFEEDTELFSSGAYDITDRSIWQVAQLNEKGIWQVPDGVNVSAIAIDATTNADGTEFILKPEETLAGYLRMQAPDDNGDPDVWHAKGAYARTESGEVDWEAAMDATNNMYAYNNARVRLIQGNTKNGDTTWLSSYRMIRNDYTRVGILPGVIQLEKEWKDQNNHDGMRPEAVTVTVERRVAGQGGQPQPVNGADGQPLTATMDESNNWSARFEQIDLVNEQGLRYLYSFKEQPVEGYESKVEFIDMNHYRLINVHPNEQLTLSGEKIWTDDDNAHGVRPETVKLTLYQDGKAIATREVRANAEGKWTYTFGNLDKYADGGTPYEYHVEEEYVPKYASETEGYQLVNNTYNPKGELTVTKTVVNATPKALEKAFTFTLVLLAEQTDPAAAPMPLMDKYPYEVLQLVDSQWQPVEGQTGTIGNGDTFTLKHNQKLLVKELPSESTYQVVETEEAGFTVTTTDAEGTIRAGQTAQADFTNTYAASGSAQLSVDKSLNGRQIRKNQFRFELVDDNPDSPTYGEVIRTARVNAPDATTGGCGDEEIVSDAKAIFGQLGYTEADAGKTFQYIVREVNVGARGFGYDATKYAVTVTVSDETGDGNLTVTPAFQMDGGAADKLTFENTYTATGELVLKAWKTLEGRELKAGEFTFELYAFDNETGDITGDCLGTATNDAEGNIEFDALTFDQNDVSLNDDEPATYTYLVREKRGSDNTVVYSNQEYVYTIKVFDNGDGTLSFAQGSQGYTREYVTCPLCAGNGYEKMLVEYYRFYSGYNEDYYGWYGSTSYYDFTATFDKPFTYKMALCEECTGLTTVNGATCGHCYGTGLELGCPYASPTSKKPSSTLRHIEYLELKNNNGKPTGIYAVALGKDNSASWVYAAMDPEGYVKCTHCDGELIVPGPLTITGDITMPVFENTLNPGSLSVTKLVEGAGSSNPGQEFTFHVKLSGSVEDLDYSLTGVEATPTPSPTLKPTETPSPTNAHREPRIPDAPVIKATTIPNVITDGHFYAKTEELQGAAYAVLYMDSTHPDYHKLVFFRSDKTNPVDPYDGNPFTVGKNTNNNRTEDTEHKRIYYYVDEGSCAPYPQYADYNTRARPWSDSYRYSDYRNIYAIEFRDPVKIYNGHRLFERLVNLQTADLSKLDTSTMTYMSQMFSGCSNLKSIIGLNGFDTSKVTSMRLMFYQCSSISELNLASFNTSEVKTMDRMFAECSGLTALDLSSFNTSNVQDMYGMFMDCSGLTSLDLSTFDTGRVTTMEEMFLRCSSLTSLDLSTFNTSSVTNMRSTFSNCTSLTSLDLCSFDTSEVKDMYGMFTSCANLASLNLCSFNTSQVSDMYKMFCNCKSLTSLDLSTFNTSSVLRMQNMFEECSSLVSLDLSNFDTRKVENFNSMFQDCENLTNLNLSGFQTNKSLYRMFSGCNSLETLDIRGIESNTASNDYAFPDVIKINTITIGDNFVRGSGYPKASTSAPYDGRWVNLNDPNLILTDKELFGEGNHAGTWTWHKRSYKLNFHPGDGAGSMPSKWVECGTEYSFVPMFYYFGHELTGFTDGTTTYPVENSVCTIPADSGYGKNQEVTLTALWQPRQDAVTVTEDGFIVKLKANETITFNNIPAATAYEVWEETPEGWVLIKKVEDAGAIQPLVTSEAVFTNEYNPEKTSAVLRASKQMDGEGAAAGAFTFTLSQNGDVLQTKQNTAGGGISFDLIEYTAAGEYTYTIAEIPGNDATIAYDANNYTATVTVIDNGQGVLTASVAYDTDDGNLPVFQNTTKPGNLTIRKTTEGATAAAADQQFTIEVRFTDAMGQPWSGSVMLFDQPTYITDGLYTGKLGNGGVLSFTGIPAGVHYTVSEPELLPGWTMDTEKSGVIESTVTSVEELTNTYTLKGVAAPVIHKALVGRTLKEDEFTFQLVDESNYVVGTATNAADGSVIFPDISFEAKGTYHYVAVEVPGEDATVAYSGQKVHITIVMEDKEGKGRLTPTITYATEELDKTVAEGENTITNKVKPGTLKVSKSVVSDYALHAQKAFSFTLLLTDAMGQPLTGQYVIEKSGETQHLNVTGGNASFTLKGGETATITGLPHGANYAITEAKAGGFTTASTGATGTIAATQTVEAAFTNTYSAQGAYVPVASKSLSGKELAQGDFVFVLQDEEGYELASAFNEADGSITFPSLSFTEADVGQKVYQLVERDNGLAGMTYDTVVRTITLTIDDKGDGTLSVTDDLNGQPVIFTNTYDDLTSHSVQKVWQDEEDAAGLRPESISVKLYQNRVEYAQATLTAENGWAYTFTDLPAFDEQGINYSYEVHEVPVPGYTSGVNTQGNVTTITNTLLGVLEVTKTVETGNQQQAFGFTAALTLDGQPLTGSYPAVMAGEAATIETDDNGKVSFLLKHGETIRIYGLPIGANFTVAENDSLVYDSAVTEGNPEGIIQRYEIRRVGFTNNTKTTSFTVTKQWEGGSGPIELTLYANGKKLEPQPVCIRNGDVYTYENLPKYDELSNVIVYSAKEKYFERYVTIYVNEAPYEGVSDRVHDGGTIINRAKKYASFKIQKEWRGLEEGENPPAITLTLYCNGEVMNVATPKPKDGWYEYYDLPETYNGAPAVYTVVEEPLPGFTAAYKDANGQGVGNGVNGGTIVNSKIPDTGDRTPVGLAAGLVAASVIGLVLLLVWRRKKK